jgi:hypothetical protein
MDLLMFCHCQGWIDQSKIGIRVKNPISQLHSKLSMRVQLLERVFDPMKNWVLNLFLTLQLLNIHVAKVTLPHIQRCGREFWIQESILVRFENPVSTREGCQNWVWFDCFCHLSQNLIISCSPSSSSFLPQSFSLFNHQSQTFSNLFQIVFGQSNSIFEGPIHEGAQPWLGMLVACLGILQLSSAQLLQSVFW